MEKRIKKLNKKINKLLSLKYLSNDDLHILFHLYDELDNYLYHKNRFYIKNQLLKLKSELKGEYDL